MSVVIMTSAELVTLIVMLSGLVWKRARASGC